MRKPWGFPGRALFAPQPCEEFARGGIAGSQLQGLLEQAKCLTPSALHRAELGEVEVAAGVGRIFREGLLHQALGVGGAILLRADRAEVAERRGVLWWAEGRQLERVAGSEPRASSRPSTSSRFGRR